MQLICGTLFSMVAIVPKGFVLEVDLEYPKALRELHNDYPLAPDKIKIKKECFLNTTQ